MMEKKIKKPFCLTRIWWRFDMNTSDGGFLVRWLAVASFPHVVALALRMIIGGRLRLYGLYCLGVDRKELACPSPCQFTFANMDMHERRMPTPLQSHRGARLKTLVTTLRGYLENWGREQFKPVPRLRRKIAYSQELSYHIRFTS